MSSFLMNSAPTAYNPTTTSDSKFPLSEEYPQNNYMQDYYAATQNSVPQTHHHHQSAVAAHYGYHHHLYAHSPHYGYHHTFPPHPTSLQNQSPAIESAPSEAHSSYVGHHNNHLNSSTSSIHGSLPSQCYNPCAGLITHDPNTGQGSVGTPHSAVNSGSHGTRIINHSSSLPLPQPRSPSPREISTGNLVRSSLVKSPSPPECSGSDTDSEANSFKSKQKQYPWMKSYSGLSPHWPHLSLFPLNSVFTA